MDPQTISYTDGRNSFSGYLVDGSRGVTAPGVLVVHEGPGLTEHPKERARKLAELGYVAFAVDLYGETDPPLARARELTTLLLSDRAALRKRMRCGLDVLLQQDNVDAQRLGAIGFCLGGAAVLELARDGADIAATIGFHANLETIDPSDANAIKGKVLVCLGADDPIIRQSQRDNFTSEMTEAGVDWQMQLYGDTGHSFTNRDIDTYGFPGFAYDASADHRSWRAMCDLFIEAFGEIPN